VLFIPLVMDYRSAGVDVAAGREFVERIRSSVETTRRHEVIGGLGGFGGLCRIPGHMRKPLLVAGTDGVGTKLALAQAYGRHREVGIDLVAMCVNDVITSGAEPLFFLDYIATGMLQPEAMAAVVEGIAEACRRSGCALLGGETAEMPGFYPQGRYDLAGFCVAVVEEDDLVDGREAQPGDRIVAVASDGVHSNGFSLVRRILENGSLPVTNRLPRSGEPLIESLLRPTLLYAGLVKTLMRRELRPHAMAHITGGGLPENLPRCLPRGQRAVIDPRTWEPPEVFRWLAEQGNVPEEDLWNTFNMGVGFCLVVPQERLDSVLAVCLDEGHQAWEMGYVAADPKERGELSGLLHHS
jgi:phosphoribosylformylglycinamidine cyclo-ligase